MLWVEILVTEDGKPQKKIMKGNCADLWIVELQLKALALLEGNIQAVESFRNNMSTEGAPKPDPILIQLLQNRLNSGFNPGIKG